MPGVITILKFVGTTSLGLLTGVSYTLSTQSLPSLLSLPSAKPAAYTLEQTIRLATAHIRVLSTVSSASLLLAFALSPSRVRHPYLVWTAVVAAITGGTSFNLRRFKKRGTTVSVEDGGEVNGEQVEKRARNQQRAEFLRTAISGVGFVMGVVGIWGDGA